MHQNWHNSLTIHPKMVNLVSIWRFSGSRNQLKSILASPDYHVPRWSPRWPPRWPPIHQNWHNSLTIHPKMVNLLSILRFSGLRNQLKSILASPDYWVSRWCPRWPPMHQNWHNSLTINPKKVNLVSILRFSGSRNQSKSILASPDYRVPRWRPRWPPVHQNWHNSMTVHHKMINLVPIYFEVFRVNELFEINFSITRLSRSRYEWD